MEVSDKITLSDDSVIIHAYQSAGLVAHTRRLAELTKQASNESDVAALATAVILIAGSTLEALLLEVAYVTNRKLYDEKPYRNAPFAEKFRRLKRNCPDDAKELWDARSAIVHAEPHNSRTRYKIGSKINVAGAIWAAETLERLAIEIWGNDMPNWFIETTGLSPSK